MQSFRTLGRKVCDPERKKERKKESKKKNNPKSSGHFVPLHHPRAAHTLRLDPTKNPKPCRWWLNMNPGTSLASVEVWRVNFYQSLLIKSWYYLKISPTGNRLYMSFLLRFEWKNESWANHSGENFVYCCFSALHFGFLCILCAKNIAIWNFWQNLIGIGWNHWFDLKMKKMHPKLTNLSREQS